MGGGVVIAVWWWWWLWWWHSVNGGGGGGGGGDMVAVVMAVVAWLTMLVFLARAGCATWMCDGVITFSCVARKFCVIKKT